MRDADKYPTIREAAKRGPLAEHALRAMCKAGNLPGFYVGKWFYVDYYKLLEKIDRICEERGKMT